MDRFSYYHTGEPELPGQLLGICRDGRFYRFSLETFHLYEIPGMALASYNEHWHDVYHLVLFTRGNTMRLDGNIVEVPSGALTWVSPGEYHSFGSSKQPRGEYHEITFRLFCGGDSLQAAFPELLEMYFGRTAGRIERPLLLNQKDFDRMNGAYEALAEALRKNPAEVKKHIYELLAGFAGAIDHGPLHMPGPDERLHRAARLLRQNLNKPVSLAEIASQTGMSREYFCREFRKCYGAAPMQFRRNYRMALAAQILRYNDKPLKGIADELGFSDIQHLAHAFREYAGISPQRFRRKYRSKPD